MTEKESLLNSKLALDVLKELASQEEGDYSSSIAKALDKPQSSISRIIGNLESENLVERGKRDQAQYYKVDYKGIGEFWYNTILERLENKRCRVKREEWLAGDDTTCGELIQGFEDNKKQIEEALTLYIEAVLEKNYNIENMELSYLLFDSFAYAIGHNMINNENFIEEYSFLEYPKDALIYLWDLDGFSHELDLVLEQNELST